jgi:hypothetical protein
MNTFSVHHNFVLFAKMLYNIGVVFNVDKDSNCGIMRNTTRTNAE